MPHDLFLNWCASMHTRAHVSVCVRERDTDIDRYTHLQNCVIDITSQPLPYITFSKHVLLFITYLFDGLSEILI